MKENNRPLRQYILLTPVKNEGENLPKLIQPVVEQTIKPVLWVIVDDGSTDNTPEIIKEAKEKSKWIQSIRLDERVGYRDIGVHLSSVMMTVAEFAIKYCGKNEIKYEYIGNVDGDIIVEKLFFEKLIKEFEKDDKLGIAGSGTQYIKGNNTIQHKGREEEPSGGDMLIRRECFEECGGIQMSCCWDSVLKAKARLRGWKTRRFEYVKAIETRVPGSEDYWNRGIHSGESAYYLNLNPIHVLIKSMKFLCKNPPYYFAIAYLTGYFSSFIRRKEKIDDDEIKEYFWNKWKKYLQSSFSLKRKT